MATSKYKMTLSRRIKRFAHKVKGWFEYVLLEKIALPIIRNRAKDSSYISHFRSELRFARKGEEPSGMDKLMYEQVCDLLALLSTQGDSGFSIGYKEYLFTKAMRFKVLSPLTFEDSEFGSDCGDSLQNKRLSSVFKSKESGQLYDINAITKKTNFQYNIDTKELIEGNNLTWNGSMMVYDDVDTHEWFGVANGVIRPDNKTFVGENKVVVPTVEVIDDNCGRGTFLFSITKKSAFPEKFFKDYILVPAERPWVEEDRRTICASLERELALIKVLNKLPKGE